jgi:class 3 adenylate cyclase
MAPAPVKRKLAAILAADAVGYSRLMAADEEGTMKILSAHRAVIDGIIEFHEGRIINTAGDSEFASPTDAVRCAVEIQDALKTRNDSLPEERRLHFRIGVNLGDVMVKGDDLLGDGVNVAARLEGIAEPGNIYISSSVYDQIAGKLDLGFVDMGDQSLKNIDRPIRAYRVEREGRRVTAAARKPRRGAGPWIAATLGAVVVGAGIAWYLGQLSSDRQEEEAKAKVAAEVAKVRAEAEEAKRWAAAEAELAKARAEAQEAKRRAESEAARQRAEAELAKQRAAAEAAKQRAEAQATAAAEAKRALEAQGAAEARARTDAELAHLRAKAEEAKRRAAAELAAAAKIRSEAEASASPAVPPTPVSTSTASLRDGRWTAEISCPPFREFPARTITAPMSVADDAIIIEEGTPGQPRSLALRGVLNSDGTLLLRGTGVTGRSGGSRQYRGALAARLVGARYEGSGRLGARECTVTIARR